MLTPFPTLQQQRKIGCTAIKLFHIYEPLGTSVASKNVLLGKYLALKHSYNKDSFSCNNLYPCFASIARLKHLMSRKPMTPSFFDWDGAFQLFQCIFLSLRTYLHQNLAHIAFKSSQSFLGNWNTTIVCRYWLCNCFNKNLLACSW